MLVLVVIQLHLFMVVQLQKKDGRIGGCKLHVQQDGTIGIRHDMTPLHIKMIIWCTSLLMVLIIRWLQCNFCQFHTWDHLLTTQLQTCSTSILVSCKLTLHPLILNQHRVMNSNNSTILLNAINCTLMLGILNGQLQYDDIATPYNHKIKFTYSFN